MVCSPVVFASLEGRKGLLLLVLGLQNRVAINCLQTSPLLSDGVSNVCYVDRSNAVKRHQSNIPNVKILVGVVEVIDFQLHTSSYALGGTRCSMPTPTLASFRSSSCELATLMASERRSVAMGKRAMRIALAQEMAQPPCSTIVQT